MSSVNSSSTSRRAALVTGGAIRLGRAIAQSLARMDFDIALHYHQSEKAAEELAGQLNDLGVKCQLFGADLSRQDEMLGLIGQVKEAFGQLSLLVNSASIFEKGGLAETETEFYDRHFALNLKAPFFLSRDFARLVGRGQIINIVDQRITGNRGDYFAYSLTKKSLADLTQMAAVELGPDIRVNAIAPGFILPSADPASQDSKRLVANFPLKKHGSTDSICRSVNYLIENDYVTGQVLFVDGGEHL